MSVFILKAKRLLNDDEAIVELPKVESSYALRPSHPVFYAATKKGYTNKQLTAEIIQKFREIWHQRYPGLHCFVFSDQLAAHFNLPLVEKSYKEGVYLWALPVNTSHFLQPLDNLPFARFKARLYTEVDRAGFSSLVRGQDVPNTDLIDIVLKVDREVFTSRAIRRSFLATGLFPFQPNKMRRLARMNVLNIKTDPERRTEKLCLEFSKILATMVKPKHKKSPKITIGVPMNVIFDPEQKIQEKTKRKKKREKRRKKRNYPVWERKGRLKKEKGRRNKGPVSRTHAPKLGVVV